MIKVRDPFTQHELSKLIRNFEWVKNRVANDMAITHTNILCWTELMITKDSIREDGYSNYVSWAWYRQECDEYGVPVGDPKFAMNGAWVNHGTADKPNWGSHS